MPVVKVSDSIRYPKFDESREEIKMVGFAEYFINKLWRENISQEYKV